ncbi:DinB family protein [Sphingosinicella sp. CPCC 101087]|uniref:DinB family protein n=1 Tax=Sphingosinicella sp. CPCC 101087 TaxID=2497754 RepID=UPI00101C9DA8|nr:DinB family protein [Sphingosinicella sp. CPCC 101087]
MATCPYRTLMRYKRWATNDLNAVIAANVDRLGESDRLLIRRLLDHIQTVDEIFSHVLEGREPVHAAPRSAELPEFETLARNARTTAAWYADYADALTPERRDEAIDFRFSSGAPGRMTRGEMLLHVAMHGTYHRGNVGVLLHKNGVEPPQDRITDFLESAHAGAVAPVSKPPRPCTHGIAPAR